MNEPMDDDLDPRADALLGDPAHAGSPLRPIAEELLQRCRDQHKLLDRVTRIADRYQNVERERTRGYAERYERQLRQLDKVVRISDHYQAMLQDLKTRLQWLSTRDELTGLPNRRDAMTRLAGEASYADRAGGLFCIALVDVDHFKEINDNYGHAVGDMVLARIAVQLQQAVREYDICARWGGEEFLVVFPRIDQVSDAFMLAERLREAIGTPSENPPVTLSVGVTAFRQGERIDETLQRADNALYQAKDQGRNRTIMG
jgi:diguanylate cyclase (GGDEF)-like protein